VQHLIFETKLVPPSRFFRAGMGAKLTQFASCRNEPCLSAQTIPSKVLTLVYEGFVMRGAYADRHRLRPILCLRRDVRIRLMSSSPSSHAREEIYSFGPFTADSRTGELLKRTTRIPLEPMAFSVLLILLKSPGKAVSRAEIIEEVWFRNGDPARFDDNLGQAIKKIRQALNDSAKDPCYIKTCAGYGFEFIAPIRASIENPPAESPSVSPREQAPTISGPSPHAEVPKDIIGQSIPPAVETPPLCEGGIAEPQFNSSDGYYAGEGQICAAISFSYGVMVGLALPAEVAYRWPEFRHWAVQASAGAGLASVVVAGISFRLIQVRVAARQDDALAVRAPGILCLWTLLLIFAVVPWLPNESIVQANWQTLTAKVGFGKSLLEALALPLLSLVPVQAVLALRKVRRSGDLAPVRSILRRRSSLAMLRGTLVPGPMFTVIAYTVITLWWLNANAHLLENLKIAAYYPLFVEVAVARAGVGLITLTVVLLWYLLRWNQLMSPRRSNYEAASANLSSQENRS
jgi:DNA-binding winged helix-turn-helix (wHTH) protein